MNKAIMEATESDEDFEFSSTAVGWPVQRERAPDTDPPADPVSDIESLVPPVVAAISLA